MPVDVYVAQGPGGQHDLQKIKVDAFGNVATSQNPPSALSDYEPQTLTVGTVEVALPAPVTSPVARIQVQGHDANNDVIYLGKPGVKADGTTGAIGVFPGQILELPTADYTQYKAIAASLGNILLVTYLPGS